MQTIEFSAGDVARIRFGLSCLWEVMTSVRVLGAPGEHAIHLPWVTRVRPRLGEILPAGGLLSSLVPPMSYMPDFLTPVPGTLQPDLADELDVLRATPADVVRADLRRLGGLDRPSVAAMYADPPAGLHRLATEIEAYWQVAIAPHWPRILVVLEAEVFYRARRLAADGAGGLLNDLHHRVRWEGDTLSIAHQYCSATNESEGAGLLLVPSAFVWPSVLTVTAGEPRQLAYPARGVATLWECAAVAPEALTAVIGRGRAMLLAELASPASTTELARRTGMSAGGVSQHLSALRAAGLVVAHRDGHAVLNVRTPTAESLLLGAAG